MVLKNRQIQGGVLKKVRIITAKSRYMVHGILRTDFAHFLHLYFLIFIYPRPTFITALVHQMHKFACLVCFNSV